MSLIHGFYKYFYLLSLLKNEKESILALNANSSTFLPQRKMWEIMYLYLKCKFVYLLSQWNCQILWIFTLNLISSTFYPNENVRTLCIYSLNANSSTFYTKWNVRKCVILRIVYKYLKCKFFYVLSHWKYNKKCIYTRNSNSSTCIFLEESVRNYVFIP